MTIRKATTAFLAAVLAIAMTSFTSLAASDFEGVWKVKDSTGQSFEITLSANGSAKASLRPDMVGTWKERGGAGEEGFAAVITWNTGWTTTIAKEADHYKHTAYRKGQATEGQPANSSDAQKVK